MVKQALKGMMELAAGIAVGAVAGAGIAYLTAPRSGDDLRKQGQELVDAANSAGERARIDREGALRDKFRSQVGRRDALTMTGEDAAIEVEPNPPTVAFSS